MRVTDLQADAKLNGYYANIGDKVYYFGHMTIPSKSKVVHQKYCTPSVIGQHHFTLS